MHCRQILIDSKFRPIHVYIPVQAKHPSGCSISPCNNLHFYDIGSGDLYAWPYPISTASVIEGWLSMERSLRQSGELWQQEPWVGCEKPFRCQAIHMRVDYIIVVPGANRMGKYQPVKIISWRTTFFFLTTKLLPSHSVGMFCVCAWCEEVCLCSVGDVN